MCIFLSWLHFEGQDLFIDDDVIASEQGKDLEEYLDKYYWEDVVGHGALMKMHKMGSFSGDHIEVAGFSDPKNFPRDILVSIDKCKFRNVGMPDYAGDMLTAEIYKTYAKQKEKEKKISDERRKLINDKINGAIEELRAVDRARVAKYNEDCDRAINQAYRDRNRKVEELDKGYTGPKFLCPERKIFIAKQEEIRNEYYHLERMAVKKRDELKKESGPNKKVDALFKKQNRDIRAIHYDYKKIQVSNFWDLFEIKENRKPIWRNII